MKLKPLHKYNYKMIFLNFARSLRLDYLYHSSRLRFFWNRLKFKCRKEIRVVFFASNVSMWNYQGLYDILCKDKRFKGYIVISPIISYAKEQIEADVNGLRHYFDSRNIPYIDWTFDDEDETRNIGKNINPDILFYTQPYDGIHPKGHEVDRFLNKLLCYVPYAFWTATDYWGYNLLFHQLAWKLYYTTEVHLNGAKKYCRNKGRNVVVSGYPKTDRFLVSNHNDVWKIKDRNVKRIIWAPHFTISGIDIFVNHSTFLSVCDVMLNIARNHPDIQIAFKPHPRLLSELYKHPKWGEERTNAYYEKWDNLPNTFIASGDYIDLFMTSDAMIHDSSSFSVEYLYSQKPVMYLSSNIEGYKNTLNELGKEAIDSHYNGSSEEDVLSFIDDVVLYGNDTMQDVRKVFFTKYLLPPNGRNVSENIYEDILTSLKMKKL